MFEKHILIVTPVFPFPLNSGGAQAQYHMIDALRKELHLSLAYISPKKKDEDVLKERWPEITFHNYPKERPNWFYRKYKKKLTSLFRKIDRNKKIVNPYLSLSFEENIDYGFINFLQDIIQQDHIEIIQFEFAPLLNMAFAFPDVKRIFVQHEIHFMRNLRFIKDFKKLPACDFYQFNLLKHQEITAMNACDAVITLTEIDKQILKEENIKTPIFVSPAAIPPPNETLPEYKFSNTLIFLGGESHSPNYEGVTWFLENIWDSILQEKPNTFFIIIGKWRERTQNNFTKKYKNVQMPGFIPSILPYSTNSIMVIPILTGSGMRMKIIEAANNGIPFITTQVGVEGLEFTNNKDCYIEDQKEKFIQKTIALMDNQQTQLSFRKSAFDKIKQIYPIEQIIKQRLHIYEQVDKQMRD